MSLSPTALVTFGLLPEDIHPHLPNFPHLERAVRNYRHHLHFGDDIKLTKFENVVRLDVLDRFHQPQAYVLASGPSIDPDHHTETLESFRKKYGDENVHDIHIREHLLEVKQGGSECHV